jgi:TatA/E family protein of Tat protein translocase
MGSVGFQEMGFIFLLALLLFGPKKLPELGRMFGKALTEFRRAQSELKATFEREMKNLDRENESLKEITSGYQSITPTTIILHTTPGCTGISTINPPPSRRIPP